MYKPIKILITGCAGFIGGHITNYLVNKYPEINFVGLDILDYPSNMKNLNNCLNKHNFSFVEGSVTNLELIRFLTKDIDTIMHFAAQTHVDNSFGDSMEFTHTNVIGTHALLECAKENKISRFIHVSTDEVYGEIIGDAATENAMLNPTNPYAASKTGAEALCYAYKTSFNLPIIITRSNNIFGTQQYPEKVIPKFINQLLKCEKITIHGKGDSIRNFLHVSQLAKAFELILFEGKIGEIYNIGTDYNISVKELSKLIFEKLQEIIKENPDLFTEEQIGYILKNKFENIVMFIEDRPFNDAIYKINFDKIKELGWINNSKSFEEELYDIILWYCENTNYW